MTQQKRKASAFKKKRLAEHHAKRLAGVPFSGDEKELANELLVGKVVSAEVVNIERASSGGVTIDFSVRLPRAIDRAEEPSKTFDPWTASPEAALSFGGHQSPEFVAWAKASIINGNRAAIESDGMALLDAVQLLMSERLRPPIWLARAFVNRMMKFQTFEMATLDDAFDHVPSDERTRKAQLRRRELRPAVHAALVEEVKANPARPVSIDLFEEVGERFGIGKTLCHELYTEAVELGRQDLVNLKQLLNSGETSSAESAESPVLHKKQ